jgi:DNA polymerase V
MAANPILRLAGHPSPHAARLARPLLLEAVQAGFPSPADDYLDTALDLNEHLVENPAATFFMRAAGDSMEGAGVRDGDILVVDRARQPRQGSIVVASVHGELTVKRFRTRDGRALLLPENPDYAPLVLDGDEGLDIWGVVTFVIHKAG